MELIEDWPSTKRGGVVVMWIAEMKAEMERMQKEMNEMKRKSKDHFRVQLKNLKYTAETMVQLQSDVNGMKGRSSLEELERQSASMKNQVDDVNELRQKCQVLEGRCESLERTVHERIETDEMKKSRLSYVDKLEQKCQFLEGRCESLERTMQNEADERKKQSARIIVALDAKMQGLSASHKREMDDLRAELQSSSSQEMKRIQATAEEQRVVMVQRITNELKASHAAEVEKDESDMMVAFQEACVRSVKMEASMAQACMERRESLTAEVEKAKTDILAMAKSDQNQQLEQVAASQKEELARVRSEMDASTSQAMDEARDDLESKCQYLVARCESLEMTGMTSQLPTMQNEMDEVKSRLSHVDELECRCESLERTVQILTKSTSMTYSAPAIPARYWVNRGFDQHYVAGVEKYLKEIESKTCALRSGTCNEHILLGGGYGNGSIMLLHDDAFLPHWEEFANALQLCQNPKAYRDLFLCNMQLPSSVIHLLKPALKNNPMTFFLLDNTEFVNAREGIDFAIEVIQSNHNLKKFNWINNPITSMDDAQKLVEAIIRHPLIDSIRLENCLGGDMNAYNVLRSLLASNKVFEHIDLESNNIRTGGGTDVPRFLAANFPLTNLYLAKNHLDDTDTIMIARALKRNTNLQHLRLAQNSITGIGRNALRDVIFDSTSLNAVADSNHSCHVEDLDGITNIVNTSPQVNRGRKIYSLLSSRNREGTNVRHLDSEFEDDDSLKLVPKVLESVHVYAGYRPPATDYVHPLEIMYEILLSWKMPTLYENN